MAKALTREDLLYILNSVFTLSRESDNAFELKEDGLYVEDYHNHSNQSLLHVPTPDVHEIISKLSVNQAGQLLFDGQQASLSVSEDPSNSLEVKSDGLYVKLIPTSVDNHLNDNVRHITQNERDAWNGIYQAAQDYTDDEINKLVIQRVRFVNDLPVEDQADPQTVYLHIDEDTAEDVTVSMIFADEYKHLNITNKTLRKYYTKEEIDDKFITKQDTADTYYVPTNRELLEDLANDNGHVVFKNKKFLSSRGDNGLSCDSDGGLYYPNLEAQIHSLMIAASFSKTNLLDMELHEAGRYTLKDFIDNYNMLLIEYYYKPSEEDLFENATIVPGYAKTAIVDPDTLNFLHTQSIDYCLEIGYGISNANTKINMHLDEITVNYYHNICIYKITGIGRKESGLMTYDDSEEEDEDDDDNEEIGGES